MVRRKNGTKHAFWGLPKSYGQRPLFAEDAKNRFETGCSDSDGFWDIIRVAREYGSTSSLEASEADMNSAEYFAAACLALHFLLSSLFPSSDCVDLMHTSSYTFLCYIHESYEFVHV